MLNTQNWLHIRLDSNSNLTPRTGLVSGQMRLSFGLCEVGSHQAVLGYTRLSTARQCGRHLQSLNYIAWGQLCSTRTHSRADRVTIQRQLS